jgi:hypothetical protein
MSCNLELRFAVLKAVPDKKFREPKSSRNEFQLHQ